MREGELMMKGSTQLHRRDQLPEPEQQQQQPDARGMDDAVLPPQFFSDTSRVRRDTAAIAFFFIRSAPSKAVQTTPQSAASSRRCSGARVAEPERVRGDHPRRPRAEHQHAVGEPKSPPKCRA